MRKSIFKTLVIMVPLLVVITGCGKDDDNKNSSSILQVERLARPAINEGLLLSNDNLNAFNSITPASDLDAGNPAVLAVQTEASNVITVVRNLGATAGAGATQPATTALVVEQFLPDVMRISVLDADIVGLVALDARTGNQNKNQVGYVSCLGAAGAPLLCGGRKIRDDVIDITLSYIATGAAGAGIGGAAGLPAYTIRDNIDYSTSHTQPLLATFPFLAAPL